MPHFLSLSQSFDILFHFFFSLHFVSAFRFGMFLLMDLQAHEFFCQLTTGHQSPGELIKVILHFCDSVFDFDYFLLILGISIFLLTLPICSYKLLILSIGALSIINHGYFNSQSDNSKIFAISDSGSVCYLLCLSRLCIFFTF